MADKTCPKCGKSNPGEAVMCWACYTPLTGAAAVPGVAAVSPPETISDDEKETRPVPPALMAGVALLVLIAAFIGFKTFAGPSAQPADPSPPTEEPVNNKPVSGGGGISLAPPTGVAGIVPPPAEHPFQITTLPNPRTSTGTMAIVPTEENLGETQAAALAAFTLRRYSRTQIQRWNGFYIFVFKDRRTADAYNAYVRERRGAVLTPDDYQRLVGIWPNTLVRYEYRNKHEYVVYPSKNVSGWWLDPNAGKT